MIDTWKGRCYDVPIKSAPVKHKCSPENNKER